MKNPLIITDSSSTQFSATMRKCLILILVLFSFLSSSYGQLGRPFVINAGTGKLQSENFVLTYYIGDYIGYDNLPESILETKLGEITIYPTPVRTILYLETSIPDLEKVLIFNINGVIIKEVKLTDNKIDFSGFRPGMYIIKIKAGNNEEIGSMKVLKY